MAELRAGLQPELRLLTKQQAAALLSVSVRMLEMLVGRGEIRPTHVGRSVRISEAALAAYVANASV